MLAMLNSGGRYFVYRNIWRIYSNLYNLILLFIPPQASHGLDEKILESINGDDYDNAVSKIMIGPKKNSHEDQPKDDIGFLIKEIREKLKESPATIFPFIESCSRIADWTVTPFFKDFNTRFRLSDCDNNP